ncbi:hypothetical protein Val02_89530 [Virgisporangium aliadipatigenens]|uniref:Uncharacterized protein n=1 Tax=Virgisporangium aliadipatigenens TaxID=741659 RepID=A0A8J3YWN6_9ACTN|nr:hypothetical protein [Virgisporangium aliadipatigenens]GIJ52067.1 hypothetical protein Val02_89530 [Virgisporangium aliadipatigenens]
MYLRRLGALDVSIIETLVIFVGIPAGVIALIVGLVFGGSARRARRYRPGRPFDFTPVWFLSAPEQQVAAAAVASDRHAVSGANRLALSKAEVSATAGNPPQDVTGGASDRW